MKTIKCQNCGSKNKQNAKFCINCGSAIETILEEQGVDASKASFLKNKKIIVIVATLLCLGIISTITSSYLTHKKDLQLVTSFGITLEQAETELDELNSKKEDVTSSIEKSKNELEQVKKEIAASKKELPTYATIKGGELLQGTYTVGSDLKEGVYDIKYTSSVGEDTYWSNDYLSITRAGSEGKSETLGGTKFDERIGGFSYEVASKGTQGHFTLKKGDTIKVDSQFGKWTY